MMCFMMLLASRRKVMGKLILPFYLKILGWLATAIMAVAAARDAANFRKIEWCFGSSAATKIRSGPAGPAAYWEKRRLTRGVFTGSHES